MAAASEVATFVAPIDLLTTESISLHLWLLIDSVPKMLLEKAFPAVVEVATRVAYRLALQQSWGPNNALPYLIPLWNSYATNISATSAGFPSLAAILAELTSTIASRSTDGANGSLAFLIGDPSACSGTVAQRAASNNLLCTEALLVRYRNNIPLGVRLALPNEEYHSGHVGGDCCFVAGETNAFAQLVIADSNAPMTSIDLNEVTKKCQDYCSVDCDCTAVDVVVDEASRTSVCRLYSSVPPSPTLPTPAGSPHVNCSLATCNKVQCGQIACTSGCTGTCKWNAESRFCSTAAPTHFPSTSPPPQAALAPPTTPPILSPTAVPTTTDQCFSGLGACLQCSVRTTRTFCTALRASEPQPTATPPARRPSAAPTSPTPSPTPAPTPVGGCAGHAATFDAKYGGCETYTSTARNHRFCPTDIDTTIGCRASDACPQCNATAAPLPTAGCTLGPDLCRRRRRRRGVSALSSPSRPSYAATVDSNGPATNDAADYRIRRQLVIPVRFSDHSTRHVPTRNTLDAIFNARGGLPTQAPLGSARDYYLENSYHKQDIVSTVLEWVDLPHPES